MHIFSTLLFALTANIDNFTVGIAYGVKKIKINIFSNMLIAAISSIGTFISMSIGYLISKFIPITISNFLGSIILIGIGLWFIKDFFFKKNINDINSINREYDFEKYTEILDNPYKADVDNSGNIDLKESITLSLALTINNFGLGLGASITGLNILLTTLFTFIFSQLTIMLGYFLGNSYLSRLFGKYAPLFSGVMIVIFGIYEIFT
jgi:putative sporulation protein YtaF